MIVGTGAVNTKAAAAHAASCTAGGRRRPVLIRGSSPAARRPLARRAFQGPALGRARPASGDLQQPLWLCHRAEKLFFALRAEHETWWASRIRRRG